MFIFVAFATVIFIILLVSMYIIWPARKKKEDVWDEPPTVSDISNKVMRSLQEENERLLSTIKELYCKTDWLVECITNPNKMVMVPRVIEDEYMLHTTSYQEQFRNQGFGIESIPMPMHEALRLGYIKPPVIEPLRITEPKKDVVQETKSALKQLEDEVNGSWVDLIKEAEDRAVKEFNNG